MARSASGGWQPSDRHASAELACRACEGAVVQAPAPERLIRNGIPTEALVAVRNGPEMRNDDGEISTSELIPSARAPWISTRGSLFFDDVVSVRGIARRNAQLNYYLFRSCGMLRGLKAFGEA